MKKRVNLQRTFAASLDLVWELWTTKEGIESWWGPPGFEVKVSKLELRQGLAARLQAVRDRIAWLPDAGRWRYLADPFGLVRGDALHVFVEAFDYRIKRAHIERHEFALANLSWRGQATVLDKPFHLSYPQVFEHDGETWMVPESFQAGEIALYRATDASLDHWERECALLGGMPGVPDLITRYMERKMEKLDIPPIPEFIEMISDTGAGIYACKASVDLFELDKDDLVEQVQGIITVGEFYEHAAGGQIIYT